MTAKERDRARYLANRDSIIAREKARYWANRDEILAQKKVYAQKTKAARAEQAKRYRSENRVALATRKRVARIYQIYGLTPEEYEAMWNRQGGRCAVCGTPESELTKKPLHVDHDHATGKIRGLTCHPCNLGIGLLGDTRDGVAKALAYLDMSESVEVAS